MNELGKSGQPPLFQRALAENWDLLPVPVRNLHNFEDRRIATGTARVERGASTAARFIAWLFGFPKAAKSLPVEVIFQRDGTGEIWTRRFGDASFTTRLDEPSISSPITPTIVESFGVLAFDLALRLEQDRLHLAPIAWRLCGIPLPVAFAPHGNSYESPKGENFAFHIEICIPVVGLIVRYVGTLNHLQTIEPA